MSLDWIDSISIAVTEANVTYVAFGPEVLGSAEISGNGSISRYSNPEPSRQELRVSLTIQGRPASQAKREATVWPIAFDEVTTANDIIGIILKRTEFDHRQGHVFLNPAQFDRLLSI